MFPTLSVRRFPVHLWKFVDGNDEVVSPSDRIGESEYQKSFSVGVPMLSCSSSDGQKKKMRVIVEQKFLGTGCLFRTDRHHNYVGFAMVKFSSYKIKKIHLQVA
jgi:hypothetical protein